MRTWIRWIFLLCLIAGACVAGQKHRQAAQAKPAPAAAADTSVIVVKTCINWKGEVVSTEYLESQSIKPDTALVRKALESARNYRFEEKPGSPVTCGEISFKYMLKKKND